MEKSYADFCYFCAHNATNHNATTNPEVCKECGFNPLLMLHPLNYILRDGLTWSNVGTGSHLDDNNDWVPYKDVEKAIEKEAGFDPVSRPSHYTEGRQYEPRKVIHDWGLNFNLGNAVKYISRAGRKGDALEDLKKARQYLDFEIEEMEKEGNHE